MDFYGFLKKTSSRIFFLPEGTSTTSKSPAKGMHLVQLLCQDVVALLCLLWQLCVLHQLETQKRWRDVARVDLISSNGQTQTQRVWEKYRQVGGQIHKTDMGQGLVNVPFWRFLNIISYYIPVLVGWCETLGHQSQALWLGVKMDRTLQWMAQSDTSFEVWIMRSNMRPQQTSSHENLTIPLITCI